MATLSSHTLNGTDGTHASGIHVSLYLMQNDRPRPIFSTAMDAGGRLKKVIPEDEIISEADYELVFETGAYWQSRHQPNAPSQIMQQVRLRFSMPDPGGDYHMPIIISPNSYSVWWSS